VYIFGMSETMQKAAISAIFLLTASTLYGQTSIDKPSLQVAMTTPPASATLSREELEGLLAKVSASVTNYQQALAESKPSLDKTANEALYDKGIALSAQASDAVAALRKSDNPSYVRVQLMSILDDMSRNAARASMAAATAAKQESRTTDPGKNRELYYSVSFSRAAEDFRSSSKLLVRISAQTASD
jgi:hypothetical protein